ncbi:cupin domain-containing protein [Candidatus Dependentiae bacterium]|nr:cupin domain-containing protein [Candidatus Dependentiae bacterium]MBU4386859.1 cupin domain-containing protein [Candidatus Dependentiae bacterium]MCG2756361.1 cupin domain-containing protein [Candidatus Dependentiae bacterium]
MQNLKNLKDNKDLIHGGDKLVNFVTKVWGHEEWIVNNSKYCGKKLVLKKGYRCSMHKHNIKDETFYILSGLVLMESEYEGKYEKRIMTCGDIMHIKIGMWHRFTGIENSEIMEFSTFHMDEDSIRREDSGSIDLKDIGF